MEDERNINIPEEETNEEKIETEAEETEATAAESTEDISEEKATENGASEDDAAEETVEEAVESTEETVEDAEEAGEEKAEEAEEETEASEEAADVVEEPEESVEEAVDTVEESTEESLETTEESEETVEETSEEIGTEAGETVEEASEEIAETTEETIETVEEASEEIVETSEEAADTIEEASEEVVDEAVEIAEKAEETVEENLVSAPAAAATAGVAGTTGFFGKIRSGLRKLFGGKEETASLTIDKTIEEVTETTEEVKEEAVEAVEETAESTEEAAAEVSEAVEEAAETIEETAEETAEEISEKTTEETTEEVTEAAEEMAESAEEAVEETTEESVEEAVEETTEESVEEAVDETPEESVETAEETTEEVGEDAEDAVEEAADTAEDSTEKTTEEAEETVEEATEEVTEAEEQPEEALEETSETIEDTTEEATEEVEEAAEESAEEVALVTEETVEEAEETVEESTEEVTEETVEETADEVTEEREEAAETAEEIAEETTEEVRDAVEEPAEATEEDKTSVPGAAAIAGTAGAAGATGFFGKIGAGLKKLFGKTEEKPAVMVEEAAGEVTKSLEDAPEEVAEAAVEVAETAEETSEEVTEEAVEETAETTEEPAEEITEEAAEETVEEVTEETAEEVTEETSEEVSEEASEEVTEEAAEEVEETPEDTTEEAAEEAAEVEEETTESAEEAVEEPAAEVAEEAAEETSEEIAEEAAEEPAAEVAEETVEEASEEVTEENVEEAVETAEEVSEETAEEVTEETTEEVSEETSEEVTEEAAEQSEAADEESTETAEKAEEESAESTEAAVAAIAAPALSEKAQAKAAKKQAKTLKRQEKYAAYRAKLAAKEAKKKSRPIGIKILKGFFKTVGIILLVLVSLGICAGVFAASVVYFIAQDAPEMSVEDVYPTMYPTIVLDAAGNEIAKLTTDGSNRAEITEEEITDTVRYAVIDIEDERFYEHKGVDPRGIIRAVKTNLSTDRSEGASTITQQLIKNAVFAGGMEDTLKDRVTRKIQEWKLALDLEKQMTKEEILVTYLNTINMGSGVYGIKEAAEYYFDKDLADLTIAECAVLAGITQNPTANNPFRHPETNRERQLRVLNKMLEHGHITQAEYDEAAEDMEVYDRIQSIVSAKQNATVYSYFIDSLLQQVLDDFQEKFGYTEEEAEKLLYAGGLTIYATQNPTVQSIVDEEMNDPDNFSYASPTSYSIIWNMVVQRADGTTVNYDQNMLSAYHRETLGQTWYKMDYWSTDEADAAINDFKKYVLTEGDTILTETVLYPIQPQVSFSVMDYTNGQVLAVNGGRGEKTANLTLSRATDTFRQPGSTFKPLASFGPAIDMGRASLETPIVDEPFTYPNSNGKQVRNWWGEKYRGLATVRDGIRDSMNIVAVKNLNRIGPENVIPYLQKMGFSTITMEDANLATALGGLTYGVSNLELCAAYSMIANKGTYIEPSFYTKILNYDGSLLLDREPKTEQVFQEYTTTLLTQALIDVVQSGTGTGCNFWTAPLAGKTGTTNDNRDIWFAGFIPYGLCSCIWVGQDDNASLWSTSVHMSIYSKTMGRIVEALGLEGGSFAGPGQEIKCICKDTGMLATENCTNTEIRFYQYGFGPTAFCTAHPLKGNLTGDDESSTTKKKEEKETKEKQTTKPAPTTTSPQTKPTQTQTQPTQTQTQPTPPETDPTPPPETDPTPPPETDPTPPPETDPEGQGANGG